MTSIDAHFLLPEHAALADEVRAFAEENISPRVAEMDASGEIDVDLVRAVARRGWVSTVVPAEHGGPGLGHRAKAVILDQLSRISGAVGAAAQASDIPLALLLRYATEEQKQRWLPTLAKGQYLATIEVTEPVAGGFVAGTETTATRHGDHYVLNGHKTNIGNSHVADLHVVIARTSEQALSAFIVESDRPGLKLPGHPTMSGLRGFSYGDVVYDGVRVPVTHRIGAEGQGLEAAYAASVLHGRLNIAAVSVGLHRALCETTVNYVRDSKRLSRQQTVQQRIGQMRANCLTAQTMVYRAAWLLDRGEDCDVDLYASKLIAIELALESVRLAEQVFSARALREPAEINRLCRDIRCLWSPAGTADVQRYRLWQHTIGTAERSWSARFS